MGVHWGKVGVLVTSTVLSGVLEGWMTSGLSALGVVVAMSGVKVLGMTGSEGDGWMVKVGDDMSTTWQTHSTVSMVPGTQLLTQISTPCQADSNDDTSAVGIVRHKTVSGVCSEDSCSSLPYSQTLF